MRRLAGAAQLAREWGDYTKDATPDLSLWDYTDTWLEGDHQVALRERPIDAVSTPGHTQGHFVFADLDDQLLFAGDPVLPTHTPNSDVRRLGKGCVSAC